MNFVISNHKTHKC